MYDVYSVSSWCWVLESDADLWAEPSGLCLRVDVSDVVVEVDAGTVPPRFYLNNTNYSYVSGVLNKAPDHSVVGSVASALEVVER